MKIVNGWMMEGSKSSPSWDGTGKHPILDMTIDEIRAHAAASAENYEPRAESETSIKPLTLEEEAAVMTSKAADMQAAFVDALANNLEPRTGNTMTQEILSYKIEP